MQYFILALILFLLWLSFFRARWYQTILKMEQEKKEQYIQESKVNQIEYDKWNEEIAGALEKSKTLSDTHPSKMDRLEESILENQKKKEEVVLEIEKTKQLIALEKQRYIENMR